MSSALVAPPVRAKTLALRWISPTALWLRPWALTSLASCQVVWSLSQK